jgi:hypothetical protein
MAQVTVDVPSFSLTVEKKQPVQVRTDVSFARIASLKLQEQLLKI